LAMKLSLGQVYAMNRTMESRSGAYPDVVSTSRRGTPRSIAKSSAGGHSAATSSGWIECRVPARAAKRSRSLGVRQRTTRVSARSARPRSQGSERSRVKFASSTSPPPTATECAATASMTAYVAAPSCCDHARSRDPRTSPRASLMSSFATSGTRRRDASSRARVVLPLPGAPPTTTSFGFTFALVRRARSSRRARASRSDPACS